MFDPVFRGARVKAVRAGAEEIEVSLNFDMERAEGDIAAAAVERLKWDVSVPTDAVRAKVEKGLVTLTREVPWHLQRDAEEHDVRHLFGVIGPPGDRALLPGQLAQPGRVVVR